eukprot:4875972-Pyramimonas_sp.AAC.1
MVHSFGPRRAMCKLFLSPLREGERWEEEGGRGGVERSREGRRGGRELEKRRVPFLRAQVFHSRSRGSGARQR